MARWTQEQLDKAVKDIAQRQVNKLHKDLDAVREIQDKAIMDSVDKYFPSLKQVITGTCPSKSNCYRIGHKGLFKTDALKKYEDSFYIQCNQYRNANIEGYIEFYVDVFYPNQRADLDNSMKIILDCCQKVKAFSNDNKVVKIVANKFLDKANPRIEFEIRKV